MKRLIFLLLMVVAMVGFVSALDNVAHPPGKISLAAEIACIGAACGCPVISATVPAGYDAVTLLPVENTALCGNDRIPINILEIAAGEIINKETFLDTGQRVDYYQRV